jgi:hypothetical protein
MSEVRTVKRKAAKAVGRKVLDIATLEYTSPCCTKLHEPEVSNGLLGQNASVILVIMWRNRRFVNYALFSWGSVLNLISMNTLSGVTENSLYTTAVMSVYVEFILKSCSLVSHNGQHQFPWGNRSRNLLTFQYSPQSFSSG